MNKLSEAHKNMEFHFILGTDLIPGLIRWDAGQQFIDETNFIIFERKGQTGFEDVLDDTVVKDYQMPKHYQTIKSE